MPLERKIFALRLKNPPYLRWNGRIFESVIMDILLIIDKKSAI